MDIDDWRPVITCKNLRWANHLSSFFHFMFINFLQFALIFVTDLVINIVHNSFEVFNFIFYCLTMAKVAKF